MLPFSTPSSASTESSTSAWMSNRALHMPKTSKLMGFLTAEITESAETHSEGERLARLFRYYAVLDLTAHVDVVAARKARDVVRAVSNDSGSLVAPVELL